MVGGARPGGWQPLLQSRRSSRHRDLPFLCANMKSSRPICPPKSLVMSTLCVLSVQNRIWNMIEKKINNLLTSTENTTYGGTQYTAVIASLLQLLRDKYTNTNILHTDRSTNFNFIILWSRVLASGSSSTHRLGTSLVIMEDVNITRSAVPYTPRQANTDVQYTAAVLMQGYSKRSCTITYAHMYRRRCEWYPRPRAELCTPR